jgi:hypothetical protein
MSVRKMLKGFHQWRALRDLPGRAREQLESDRKQLPAVDPGPKRIITEGVQWLCRAQDSSATSDGGVARHYSLIKGWAPSYPETTGYIVPTILSYAERSDDPGLLERARRMIDWLVSIQLESGGFQGGVIGAVPVKAVTFNTGQILLGLAAAHSTFHSYLEPTQRAADWLCVTQDPDGCWRRFGSPFTTSGEKVYDTHVAWGLLEAARVTASERYGDAALANVRWALTRQRPNGWFGDCCLNDPDRPLTHTIGYALRGVIEAYLFSKDDTMLAAALKTADGLKSALLPDGSLPGRLNADWQAAVDWVCITGSSQISHCWMLLFGITGEEMYREAATRVNAWVRRTIDVEGEPDVRGGVKGSHPIDGEYGRFEYLNWAAKFTVDANLLEMDMRRRV